MISINTGENLGDLGFLNKSAQAPEDGNFYQTYQSNSDSGDYLLRMIQKINPEITDVDSAKKFVAFIRQITSFMEAHNLDPQMLVQVIEEFQNMADIPHV